MSTGAPVPLPASAAVRHKLALASLCLAMLLSSLGTSIANVGLPALAKDLDASFQDVQWVVLAYLLAVTTLVVSVGKLGDTIGRRRLMLAGIALFTVASLACASAAELWVLVAARAAQGCGAAAMMSLTLTFVGDIAPKGKTGSTMGMLGATSAVGTALGPSLGGLLLAAFGWQALFLAIVPLGTLALALAHRFLPADGLAMRAGKFDFAGTLLLALTLGAYALAMTRGGGRFSATDFYCTVGAFTAGALFLLVQSHAASPLVNLSLLRQPELRASFVMSALVTTVAMSTLVVGPFHLSGALGLGPARVGLVMSAGPLVAALIGAPAGRWVDRWGAKNITLAALATAAVGCLGLAILPSARGVVAYVFPLTVFTSGFAMFQAANNTAVMASMTADQRGVVSGLLTLSRNLGLITGASVMGALYMAGGMPMTFGMATLLLIAAIVLRLGGSAPGLAAL